MIMKNFVVISVFLYVLWKINSKNGRELGGHESREFTLQFVVIHHNVYT